MEGACSHLCNEVDEKALAAVRAFNPYDLYSKHNKPVDPKELKPYYRGLIKKFSVPPDRRSGLSSRLAHEVDPSLHRDYPILCVSRVSIGCDIPDWGLGRR